MIPADRAAFAPGASDAGDAPPRWLLGLEQAHERALRAGRALSAAPPSGADLGPAARAIEAALSSIYTAVDSRGDRLDAVRSAAQELGLAAAMLAPFAEVDVAFPLAEGWLRESRAALLPAEERLSRVAPEPIDPGAPLRASKDRPALHRLDRDPIPPILRVADPVPPPPDPPPPLPRPRSIEELHATMAEVKRRSAERAKAREAREAERERIRAAKKAAREPLFAEPPKGFAAGRFTAISEDAHVANRTRECFEEVAMIGVQRAPILGDPWRVAKVLEDRMLASIDAVAALGPPALERLEPLVLDAPAKDPSRGFAAAMILGCFDGRDALGAVERIFHHLGPADPEVIAHVGGALKLVPHPALPMLLRTLLADPDPACRAMAVEVLAYRGAATLAELAAAAQDPSPAVAAAALPALGLVHPGEAGAAIERARAHDDPLLREAAWLAMVLSGHPQAASTLAAELSGPLASRAAVPLAITGDERDAGRLLEAMLASPTSALVGAVGWAGQPEAVPALLDLLGHDDPVIQLDAAFALDRITGARIHDEVELPPEVIAAPDVEEPDVGEPKPTPLGRLVSDPRDRPSEGSSDTATLPSIRADRWRAYWNEKGADYKPGLRYRRGSVYAPTLSLWELDTWPLTPWERRWLQRELVVRTGQHVRLDPHDFVSVQEEALRAWAPLAQRAGGGWQRPMRRPST